VFLDQHRRNCQSCYHSEPKAPRHSLLRQKPLQSATIRNAMSTNYQQAAVILTRIKSQVILCPTKKCTWQLSQIVFYLQN